MPNDSTRRAATTLLAAAIGLLFGGLACGSQADAVKEIRKTTYEFPVSVELTDKEDNPVAEAPVKFDGKVVGYTDSEGKFQGVIEEKPGTEVELALGELDGYRYVDGASTTELLELKPSLSGEGRKGVEVLLHAKAKSLKRHYLVWVKATCEGDALSEEDCRGLAIERDGETVATTDRFGMAHVHLQERSGREIAVSVESPTLEDDDSEIAPKDPSYQLETALESTVYLLEPTFRVPENEDDDRPVRRRTRRQPTSSSGGSGAGGSEGGDNPDDSGDASTASGDEAEDDEGTDLKPIEPTERTDSARGAPSSGSESGSGDTDGDTADGADESSDGNTESGSGSGTRDGPIDLFKE